VTHIDNSDRLLQTYLTRFHDQDSDSAYLLLKALAYKPYRKTPGQQFLSKQNSIYLYAVNSQARYEWGRIFIEEIFRHFGLRTGKPYPDVPLYFLTLTDRSLVLPDTEPAPFKDVKKRFRPVLEGWHHIGMIEPAYYPRLGEILKGERAISWHEHAIVEGLQQGPPLPCPMFEPIRPGLLALHVMKIGDRKLAGKLCYLLKSPANEYHIGENRTPEAVQRFGPNRNNKEPLRTGNRVRLFSAMAGDLYLDHLAFAGGEGKTILRRVKDRALQRFRRQQNRERHWAA
jgi:hypothetical protein